MPKSEIDSVVQQFQKNLDSGLGSTEISDYLKTVDPHLHEQLIPRLIQVHATYQVNAGKTISAGDYAAYGSQAVNAAVAIIAHLERLETIDEVPGASELAQNPLANEDPQPAASSPNSASAGNTASSGSHIGQYKLLQQIGEGGMGTVWMAQQERPVRRRVAIKVVKPELSSRQIIARFEAERQALAMMDHQNIARVLDAGTADGGSPYFVMELVKGIPITKFCDDRQLNIRERLELFVPVCKAIQHAHQKGILHRDLKPSNVLVALYDGKPVPKVIDFGLAKALEHTVQLTDKTMFTQFGQVVGTLQYMSPEQAEMNELDVDTRSDIYSLGVMLYELLSGSTPIDRETLRQNAMLKVLETIREKDPPAPSARLSSSTADMLSGVSRQRSIQPTKLQQILRGELDWVVMKALEKDRSRRYETANGLAEDIRRYLDDEPIAARPPSSVYRMTKFVRRNRGLVASVLAIAGLLVLGIAASTWFAVQAHVAREQFAEKANDEKAQREIADQKTREATESSEKAEKARQQAEKQTRIAQKAERDLAKRLHISDLQAYASRLQQIQLAQDNQAIDLAFDRLNVETSVPTGWELAYLHTRQKQLVPWQANESFIEGGFSINAVLKGDNYYYLWEDLKRVDIRSGEVTILQDKNQVRDSLCAIDVNSDGSRILIGELSKGTYVYEIGTRRETAVSRRDYTWLLDFVMNETQTTVESAMRAARAQPRFLGEDRVLTLSHNHVQCSSLDGEALWIFETGVPDSASYYQSASGGSKLLELWQAGKGSDREPAKVPSDKAEHWEKMLRGFQLDTIEKTVAVWDRRTIHFLDAETGEETQTISAEDPILDLALSTRQNDQVTSLFLTTAKAVYEYEVDSGEQLRTLPYTQVIRIETDQGSNPRIFMQQRNSPAVVSVELKDAALREQHWLNLASHDFAGFELTPDGSSLLYNNGIGWSIRSTAPPPQHFVAIDSLKQVWRIDAERFLVETSVPMGVHLSVLNIATEQRTPVGTITGLMRELRLWPDGSHASIIVEEIGSDFDAIVCTLDLETQEIENQFEFDPLVSHACLSNDGRKIYEKHGGNWLTENTTLKVREILLGNIIATIPLQRGEDVDVDVDLEDELDFLDDNRSPLDPPAILAVAANRPIVDASNPDQVSLIDTETSAVTALDFEPTGVLTSVCFHSNKPWLYLSFSERPNSGIATMQPSTLHCYDLQADSLRFSVNAHVGSTRRMILDDEGLRIITGGDDGTIRIWDAATGTELLPLPVGLSSVNSLWLSDRSLWYANGEGLNRLPAASPELD